ncbi:MAG TPA: molybdopterin cofactor-binding domain-containing protein [Chthoniobacterales bacterium]|nr:molybdopterin cofactor-binding domain-containing protein [Chthoniobacterales bacterium]
MISSRRTFLKTAALGGASLIIGFDGRRLFAAEKKETAQFKPNGWVRIDDDGWVTLTIGKSEMGQGVRTALAMMLADELGADWKRVKLAQASPGPAPFDDLGTGGSGSMEEGWAMMRPAAAAAREMLIAAAAAQWKVPPDECNAKSGAVVHAPSKRRLEFGILLADASKLPVPKDAPLRSPADFSFIGQRTAKIDGTNIVTGRARYGIDAKIAGMLYASVERPPWAGAKPQKMNEDAARAVRGVKLIVQTKYGVAVLAENTWAAIKGRTALAVEWGELPADAFDSEAHAKRLETASHERGNQTRNDAPPEGTPPVARTIDAVYSYPFYAHAPLETMNCIASVENDRCKLIVPTQAPNRVQKQVAQSLGTTEDKVDVEVTLIGGGFGRRLSADYAVEAAEISRAAKAPVQVLWSRPDDMKHGHFQAASAHYLAAGLDSQNSVVAWKHTKAGSFHNLSAIEPDEKRNEAWWRGWSWGVYDVPYTIPAIETAYVPVDLPVKHGPWRAVFAPSSVFARESFFDEVARECRADPIAFRLKHLEKPDTFKVGRRDIDRRRLRGVLETVRDKSGWGEKLPGGRGRGVACSIYSGTTHIAYVVDVSVNQEGAIRVERVVSAVDCGLVINPIGVEQQMEGGIIWGISSVLGGHITFKGGRAQQSTFADFPVARMRDTPAIEVHIVGHEGAKEPFGMGEPPVPPIVPAIVNAIFAATGKRIRKLPIRPEDLKA